MLRDEHKKMADGLSGVKMVYVSYYLSKASEARVKPNVIDIVLLLFSILRQTPPHIHIYCILGQQPFFYSCLVEYDGQRTFCSSFLTDIRVFLQAFLFWKIKVYSNCRYRLLSRVFLSYPFAIFKWGNFIFVLTNIVKVFG